MRLINLLFLKKILKEKLGINYVNKRITEVVVDKATNYKVLRLEHDVHVLKDALKILLKQAEGEDKEKINSVLSNILTNNVNLNTSSKNKKFIFVCGLHRSGTSLFTKILQNHPDVSGLENTGVIQDEGQFLQTVYLPDSELGWPGSFGYSKQSHLTEASDLVNEENRKLLYRQWSNYLDTNKDYLIEKSPPNLLKTRFLQALFPDSYFIVIRRHPIAACMATRKWSNSTMLALIKHWLRCYDIWNDDKQYIKKYLEIKYEDFLENPDQIISSVCRFCGLQYVNVLKDTVTQYEFSRSINERYFLEWDKHWLQKLLVNLFYKDKIKEHGY